MKSRRSGARNLPPRCSHANIGDYVASRTVLVAYAVGASPAHPLPESIGKALRRVWHQRLQQLATAGCQYTRKRWTKALQCPGYLLGDHEKRGSLSCNLRYLCPYCHASTAALAYDNAVTARLEFYRKWKRQTRWYLTRFPEALAGQVGRMTGSSDGLYHDPKRVLRPLSLVLVADGVEPDCAWPVPDTDGGLARAVARMFAYSPWLLLGPADEVATYLDSPHKDRQRVTGCLRLPSAAVTLADRKHNTFLPPRKAFLRDDASCETLEALKGAIRDYDHATEVLSRLKLPPDTPVRLTPMHGASYLDFFRRRTPDPEDGAVNVIVADCAGYLVCVPDWSPVRHVTELYSGGCKWLPLRYLCPPGSTAPPTDAIWRRQELDECSSASRKRQPSTRPKKSFRM